MFAVKLDLNSSANSKYCKFATVASVSLAKTLKNWRVQEKVNITVVAYGVAVPLHIP